MVGFVIACCGTAGGFIASDINATDYVTHDGSAYYTTTEPCLIPESEDELINQEHELHETGRIAGCVTESEKPETLPSQEPSSYG